MASGALSRYVGLVPEQTMPPKKDVARALLLRGSVFVHLDPRTAGMVVPEWLRNQPQLVLQIGLDMPIPIPDLRVDDEGVYGTLSFQRSPFTCRVPWGGIFALVGEDGRGMIWPEDLPAEIAAEVEREVGQRVPGASPAERTLRPVDGGRTGADVTPLSCAKDRGPARRGRSSSPPPADGARDHGKSRHRRNVELPPYLRIIK